MSDFSESALHPAHRSQRIPGHDYASGGFYFITICTHEKKPILGKIENATVELSKYGSLARECWVQIPHHSPRVNLHSFVLMPNHIHGIVQIGHKDAIPLLAPVLPHVDKGSLGAVIRSFKAIVTKRARADLHFEGEFWQRNYYEHLLRNEREFLKRFAMHSGQSEDVGFGSRESREEK